jgi:hypothetical protein
VRGRAVRMASSSLILRYDGGEAPKIRWASSSTLAISVGDVDDVTKMVPILDGIHIVYSVGREKFSRSDFIEEVQHLKIAAVCVLVFDLLLIIICRALIVSIRRRGLMRPGLTRPG